MSQIIDSYQQEKYLIKRVHAGDLLAREKIIRLNLGLVIELAQHFNKGEAPMSELIKQGINQLTQCAHRFDPEAGYEFSFFAGWWIKYAMARWVANKEASAQGLKEPC